MDSQESGETLNENKSAESGEAPIDIPENTHAAEEFDRMKDLRNSIAYSSEYRVNLLSRRIRQWSWILGAVVFLAILIVRWDKPGSELPGAFFIALIPSAVVVCLTELVVAVLRRRM